MISSMTTPDEQERLLELYNYDLMDTPYEEDFDEIVRLASQICNVPMSLITLVDKERQWFKSRLGLEDTETGRDVSFCAHAIAGNHEVFEVEDATKDERFHDNPFVTADPNIRFYAGVPLVTVSGKKLGTLCVLNSHPQRLTEEQSFALKVLAKQVMKLAEQRIMNRYLENFRKRLQHQGAAQNTIISVIAHDVRSPLTSLKNIVELDEEGLIDEQERKNLVSLSKKQIETTLDLLDSLSNWGKALVKTSEVENKRFQLSQLVDEMVGSFEVAAKFKNINFINKVNKHLLIKTDENALRFILRNIISNAVKYTESGSITIAASRNKKRVRISIIDTGIGMPKQQVQRLEKGMGHASTRGTRGEPGSGLGFLLTKGFIDMLDGSIAINSEQGKGTTMSFEIEG